MTDNYKYCFVPSCENTSTKNPDKYFIRVPSNSETRKKWCEAVGYLSQDLPVKAHCCNDNFNLKDDLQNYYYWEEFKSRMCLKPGIVPRYSISKTTSTAKPSKRRKILCELQNPVAYARTLNVENDNVETNSEELKIIMKNEACLNSNSSDPTLEQTLLIPEASGKSDACVQARILSPKPRKRSIHVQCVIIDDALKKDNQAKESSQEKGIMTENENQQISPTSSFDTVNEIYSDSSFKLSSNERVSTDSKESEIVKISILKENMIQFTKLLIKDNPRLYLGIDEEHVDILGKIGRRIKISKENLYLILEKIKTDHSYNELAHRYSLSISLVSRIFNTKVDKIANVLKNLIVWPSSKCIYQALPLQFRHHWASVQSIIDCFEIQIEKPSDALWQSLSWSKYKQCNTVKFLISITPGGLINYISRGYGGRISDMAIVQESGYLNMLPMGAEVLADRGFKNLDAILSSHGCRLAYPPSFEKRFTTDV